MSKVQEQRLAEKGLAEAAEAANRRPGQRGDQQDQRIGAWPAPGASDAHGLMSALRRWAAEVEDLFHISCRLQAGEPVLIHDRKPVDPPLSHRARSGEQRPQTRDSKEHHDQSFCR
jgi:hypothetical protein